ncbi:hypothetical protein GYMLUDRAFT_35648 [Collybiopsis luxurians FD-317 M1]|nr:hypothetical protein GYMLUDRAFT_35648 [Collybiopsis luxurians FD-317 M1]
MTALTVPASSSLLGPASLTSADVRQITSKLTEIVSAIKTESGKVKARDARRLVYLALALHPALNHMHPPTGNMDWYSALGTRWNVGIFKRLGQYQHFRRTGILGEIGSRARIMILLLWILGHRLTEGHIDRMLSIAVSDGLQEAIVGGSVSLSSEEIIQIDWVKGTLVELRRMIKTKLPLPSDYNPFLCVDYYAEDEDKSLPRSELWAYRMPKDQQYELDIKQNPMTLLRPLPNRIIIPQTKLTLFLAHWISYNFGLGKMVHSREDLDANTFWNADPPSSEPQDDIPTSVHAPYAPLDELPIDDWIHIRFCEVYDVHHWAHDSFIRVLLFNSFCGALIPGKQDFPSQNDIRISTGIARWLRRRLPDDILLSHIEPFILYYATAVLWRDNDPHGQWQPAQWSIRERGLAVIFTDSLMFSRLKEFNKFPFFERQSISWFDMQEFFQDPLKSCPTAPDILSLPLLRDLTSASSLRLDPELTFCVDDCICGQCRPVFEQMLHRLEWFRVSYFTIIGHALAERNCEALRISWEPTLRRAEEWYEHLLGRIESPYLLFPAFDDLPRLGPLILEVADRMRVRVGTHLEPSNLIRFILTLYTVNSEDPIPYYQPLPTTALGVVIAMPLAEGREEYLAAGQDPDYAVEYALFAIGDWLYEFAGSDGLAAIYTDDNFAIEHSLDMLRWRTVHMPDYKSDFPGHIPPRHSDDAARIPASVGDLEIDFADKVEIVLSELESDGYPLLSEAIRKDAGSSGDVAALLRVQSLGRSLESVWRPKVRMGRSCDHKHNHQIMLFCSPTAHEVLNLMESSEKCRISASVPSTHNHRILHGPITTRKAYEAEWQDALNRRMNEYATRTAPVTKRDGILETNRVCIVRCGVNEGPVNAMVVLSASLRKQVYVIHRSECWDCALLRMDETECTVGLALYTKYITKCDRCR